MAIHQDDIQDQCGRLLKSVNASKVFAPKEFQHNLVSLLEGRECQGTLGNSHLSP